MKFIYVMNEDDKNKLVALGYKMIREDNRNHVWVFHNHSITSVFSEDDPLEKTNVSFVLSDVLMF